MQKAKLNDLFYEKGYSIYENHYGNRTIYTKKEAYMALVTVVLEGEEDPNALIYLSTSLKQKFLNIGYINTRVLFVFTNPVNRPHSDYINAGLDCWFFDETKGIFIIYENMPDDFGYIKNDLENLLFETSGSHFDNNEHYSFPNAQTYKNVPRYRKRKEFAIKDYYICFSLVAINTIVFFITTLFGNTLTSSYLYSIGANNGTAVFENHEYYRLISCIFLHAGITHLVSNMIVLIIAGTRLERRIGHLKFLITYMVSGVGSSLISIFWYYINNQNVVSVGASGAIFGLFGALIVLMIFKDKTFNIVSLAYIGLFLLLGLQGAFANVDVFSHLFGFIIGGVILYIFPPPLNNE